MAFLTPGSVGNSSHPLAMVRRSIPEEEEEVEEEEEEEEGLELEPEEPPPETDIQP